MTGPGSTSYSYGDSPTAADRLALLAQIFEPTTAAFLRDAAPPGIALAIDLGCGPGYTTDLLAAATRASRVVGLDLSDAFVQRATERAPSPTGHASRVDFLRHDVTATPFPVASADVIFARYLLAHLPEPTPAVASWASQLAGPGSRLLLEEIEAIDTDVPTFARYLEVVTEMSRFHGADLLVGARLGDLVPASLRPVLDRRVAIRPTVPSVARMFGMNLSVWRRDPFAVHHVEPALLVELRDSLRVLASLAAAPGDAAIEWTHRQLAIEAT